MFLVKITLALVLIAITPFYAMAWIFAVAPGQYSSTGLKIVAIVMPLFYVILWLLYMYLVFNI